VAITDTVGLSTTTTDITNGLKRTFQRMDSSDLKICMLDMKQIYDDKSPASIDPSVMEAIDSDTIVLINKRDLVNIRIPAAPGKIRYKNSPLGPQGEIKRTAFRGKIPLRLDGDTSGNSIQHGDYGLRVLEDVRLTEACLQECRSTLHRHIKNIRGARFWLRVVPDHPVSSKPVGVRMGKGKGAFDHWEAKVPNKKIVFEIGGGVREEAARDIMRIVGTRVPGKTEFVVAEKEETIEEMSRRVREFSKVPPLGVWCISCETGEGIEDFLGELSQIIRDRYQLQCDSQEFALSEPVSLRMKCLQQCADQLSAMLSSKEALNGESLSIVSQSIQNVVQNSSVRDAVNFMFHSKYGVLHKNQIQCQQ
jgi:ribosomal protein L16